MVVHQPEHGVDVGIDVLQPLHHCDLGHIHGICASSRAHVCRIRLCSPLRTLLAAGQRGVCGRRRSFEKRAAVVHRLERQTARPQEA
eukprot:5359911-Prymnesium_polylepis.4